jgi:hypothetical protein
MKRIKATIWIDYEDVPFEEPPSKKTMEYTQDLILYNIMSSILNDNLLGLPPKNPFFVKKECAKPSFFGIKVEDISKDKS